MDLKFRNISMSKKSYERSFALFSSKVLSLLSHTTTNYQQLKPSKLCGLTRRRPRFQWRTRPRRCGCCRRRRSSHWALVSPARNTPVGCLKSRERCYGGGGSARRTGSRCTSRTTGQGSPRCTKRKRPRLWRNLRELDRASTPGHLQGNRGRYLGSCFFK